MDFSHLELKEFRIGMQVKPISDVYKEYGTGVITGIGKLYCMVYFDNIKSPTYPYNTIEVTLLPFQLTIIDKQTEEK